MEPQVLIREARPADAAQLVPFVQRLAAEPNIYIAMSAGEFTMTVADEEKFLADFAAADNSLYLIAESEGTLVGSLNCNGGRRRATRHVAELGMSVAKEWRGRGIGSRLMARAVEWARGTGIILRLQLYVYVENAPAIHLYEKFGFVVEGRLRKALYRDGSYHDDLVMGLLL